MRSLKLIIKSISQEGLAKFGFRHSFHDLIYFGVGHLFLFSIFLNFIIKFKAPLEFFVEKHKFHVVLSCLEHILDNDVFNVPTCTLLALTSKKCRLFYKNIFVSINRLIAYINVFFKWFFPSQISQLVYGFGSLSRKPMQDNGVVYLTVLAPHAWNHFLRDWQPIRCVAWDPILL